MVTLPSSLQFTDSSFQLVELNDSTSCLEGGEELNSATAAIWLVEDNRGLAAKRDKRAKQENILITLHKIEDGVSTPCFSKSLSLIETNVPNACAKSALDLVREVASDSSIIVAGTSYGCNVQFLNQLNEMDVQFALKLRATTRVEFQGHKQEVQYMLADVAWKKVSLVHPRFKTELPCLVTRLEEVRMGNITGHLLIAQVGGVTDDAHRSTVFGFSNAFEMSDEELLYDLSWARWIRESVRREQRSLPSSQKLEENLSVKLDDDFQLEIQTDLVPVRVLGTPKNSRNKTPTVFDSKPWNSRSSLENRVNMVELFAGAGGMALGFLEAQSPDKTIDLLFSGEIEPIYAQTLRANHRKWNEICGRATLPSTVEAVDLASQESFEIIKGATRTKGDVSIVVGGPPCQGFSSANRNSWSSDNPNNRLVEVFFRHVEEMMPRVFLMENVQGILWTNSQSTKLSVAHDLQRRLEKSGYLTFPHLLDAAQFGVPQHRFRYFLLGIHTDAGYRRDDFGENGPFPAPTHGPNAAQPFVTVRDAIADLPYLYNGESNETSPYQERKEVNEFLRQMRQHAPTNEITDHVTSRHAEYVIDRYREIPEGGNWQDIRHLMTNYAEIGRTHSNIYRRLKWDEPSITMGHYRKSMLIHPSEHRGLSLREAMRLQSFPDWYRFAGNAEGKKGGLVHKQQQLANAVCPLLLKAIAGQILKL